MAKKKRISTEPVFKGLKGIIIENEYDIPQELRGFIKDNKGLFAEVDEQTFCKDRPLADIARFIGPCNAVIVMSTWMYKDQLEEFVQAFGSGPFAHRDYKFFIRNFLRPLNEWNKKRSDDPTKYEESFFFSYIEIFIHNLIKLVTAGKVFSIEDDYDAKERIDQFHSDSSLYGSEPRKRHPYIYKQIYYSKEHDLFHFEGQDMEEVKKYYS